MPPSQQHQQEGEDNSEGEQDDPHENSVQDTFESTDGSSLPRSPRRTPSTSTQPGRTPPTGGSPSARAFTGIPLGVTLHVLSSSKNTYTGQRRQGNTAVRRKSLNGHSVIAEATKATGAVMATQMQEIADASRELERSKIGVQLKLFTEQMAYQREKDHRMYENASIANENARMAIMKQGEMVACLSQLSTMLGRGLTMANSTSFDTMSPLCPRIQSTRGQGFSSQGGPRIPTPLGESIDPLGIHSFRPSGKAAPSHADTVGDPPEIPIYEGRLSEQANETNYYTHSTQRYGCTDDSNTTSKTTENDNYATTDNYNNTSTL